MDKLLINLSMNIQVVNRKGNYVDLNVLKIRKVSEWACSGHTVSSIALESRLQTKLKQGISTREIQARLIEAALELSSIDAPDWLKVAGRLKFWDYREDCYINRGDWILWLNDQIDCQKFKNIYTFYSLEELQEAHSWIDTNRDLEFDFAAMSSMIKRYLVPNEMPQELFLLTSLWLASKEMADQKMKYAKQFYDCISTKKISLATPLLANLRLKKGTVTSCFISKMEDSLQSIYKVLTDIAKISQGGGGAGVVVSGIRAKGAPVQDRPNSSGGVIPWIRLINDTAIAVNQGGKRAGAVTVALDIWHLDLLDFLDLQTENGDQRSKAYDIFPQVVIPDNFMRAVTEDDNWLLFDPYEINDKYQCKIENLWGDKFQHLYEKIFYNHMQGHLVLERFLVLKAKDLFKRIMRSQIETGMPYLAFKDTLNYNNPNQNDGFIPAVNLCTESFSNVSERETHCCNLLSINLAALVEANNQEIIDLCYLGVRILDNSIDLNDIDHLPEAKLHNQKYRTIGVGVMGLADYLAYEKINYTNTTYSVGLIETLAYYCTEASINLCVEGRKPYGAYHPDKLVPFPQISSESSIMDWDALDKKRFAHGIRNSQVFAIAPNSSTAILMGATASILPVYRKFFYDKSKHNVAIAPPFLKERFHYYQENRNIDQKVLITMVGQMQRFVDTGISMELIFDFNKEDAKSMYETLVHAWLSGCKAVYYIRTIQQGTIQTCESCAG